MTNVSILEKIEEIRKNDKIDYISAIVFYCEKNDIELERIASYIKKDVVFTSRIREEAEDLNFLEKTSRLPL